MTLKEVSLRMLSDLPHCPWCKVELHALSGKHRTPNVGSISVCDQCYGISVFVNAETLELRCATDGEVQETIHGLKKAGEHRTAELLEMCRTHRKNRA